MKVKAISLISKVCSLLICSITGNTALAQTHEDAFWQNTSSRGVSMLSNMHRKGKGSNKTIMPLKELYVLSAIQENKSKHQCSLWKMKRYADHIYFLRVIKWRIIGVFRNVTLVFYKLFSPQNAMIQHNTASLYTSILHTRLNFATS